MCWWQLFKQRSLFWLYQVVRSNWKGILSFTNAGKACLLAWLHPSAYWGKKVLVKGLCAQVWYWSIQTIQLPMRDLYSDVFHVHGRWLQGARSSLSKLSRDRINVPNWKADVGLLHSMLEVIPQYLMWSELQATEIQISGKEASFHMLLRSPALQ